MNITSIKEYIKNNKDCDILSFVSKFFENKVVEIYTGEQYDIINVDQQSQSNPAVYCGKFIGMLNNFIILDCFSEAKKQVKNKNIVLINLDQIIAFKEFDENVPITNLMFKSGTAIQKKLK